MPRHLILLLLCISTAGTLLAQKTQPVPQTPSAQKTQRALVFTGATLIDANHPAGLKAQTVIISGDSIQSIGPDAATRIPDSATIIALDGKFILPGLIDTHVHMATDPSGVDNRQHTLETLQKMLRSGITTVRDMAGDARTLASLARDAHQNEIQSPDICYSALMAGPSFFTDPRTQVSTAGGIAGQMPYMQAVTNTTDLVTAVAAAKGTGATGIKLYAKLDAQLTAAIVKEASRQHILVWGHAYLNPAKPSAVIRSDISSISHACLLIYDQFDSIPHKADWNRLITPSLPVFQEMKTHHTILDATLITYKQWGQQDSTHQYLYEIAKRFTALAHQANIPVTTGTDDDQTAFVQEEMKLLVRDAGFSPADAIIAATRNGAKALGIEASAGTLQPGKKASLLILAKDPLIDIDNIDAVAYVVKGGKLIGRN